MQILLLAEILVLLAKLAPTAALLPCAQVASSECSRDQPDIVDEFHLATEEECVAICQTFAAVPDIGCTFAAWEAGGVSGGLCTLYKETFANYIGHCQLLSGPPDIVGCSVDDPEENSCHGIREGECVQDGHVTERIESIKSWRDCANICNGSPGASCKTWSYRDEPTRLCFLFDSADRHCTTSYTPSGIDGPLDCETGETTVTATATPETTVTTTATPETTVTTTATPETTATATPETSTTTEPRGCQHNPSEENGPCYLAVKDDDKSFQEAESYCSSLGGHLASSLTASEDTFIGSILDPYYGGYWWIGAQCEGFTCSPDDRWTWTDGSTWAYENWWAAAFSNCAAYVTSMKMWLSYECSSTIPFVCKI